jgi:hypothetical protein
MIWYPTQTFDAPPMGIYAVGDYDDDPIWVVSGGYVYKLLSDELDSDRSNPAYGIEIYKYRAETLQQGVNGYVVGNLHLNNPRSVAYNGSGLFITTVGEVWFFGLVYGYGDTKVAGNYPAVTPQPTLAGVPATSAALGKVLAVDAANDGSFYIADSDNHVVLRVSASGVMTTFAGDGRCGFGVGDGVPATQASLCSPNDIAVLRDGTVYIADSGNNRVRRVAPSGIITTVAGNGEPLEDGGVYGCDYGSPSTRTIGSKTVTGYFATAIPMYPLFLDVVDVYHSEQHLYVADKGCVHRVDLSDGTVLHVTGYGNEGYSIDVQGLAVGTSNVWISDGLNKVVWAAYLGYGNTSKCSRGGEHGGLVTQAVIT